jgi:hypothetical protein
LCKSSRLQAGAARKVAESIFQCEQGAAAPGEMLILAAAMLTLSARSRLR